jgi:hypothetical protein
LKNGFFAGYRALILQKNSVWKVVNWGKSLHSVKLKRKNRARVGNDRKFHINRLPAAILCRVKIQKSNFPANSGE